MKKLLFTGASGFLGSNVLPLLKENYDVDTLAFDENAIYNVIKCGGKNYVLQEMWKRN